MASVLPYFLKINLILLDPGNIEPVLLPAFCLAHLPEKLTRRIQCLFILGISDKLYDRICKLKQIFIYSALYPVLMDPDAVCPLPLLRCAP